MKIPYIFCNFSNKYTLPKWNLRIIRINTNPKYNFIRRYTSNYDNLLLNKSKFQKYNKEITK